ncbi:MAG: hypothetical protein HFI10_05480 [Lachnospiraceae bacterium]|nr:hypothetical protein [Lachnospiraceae bacterium]
MELFFNELSISGKENIGSESVLSLINVYRALRKYNITTCRIDSGDNLKLFRMIQNMPDSLNIKNFYFSFFRPPYESANVEQEQDEYYCHNWSYNERPCIGLALASILNSAGLSICENDWNAAFVHLRKDDDIKTVRNICTEEHVDIHIPQLQSEKESELVETDLQIEDKKIALRHDHGMAVLTEFSKRLIRCPYVIGIVNSLPFNPSERKFIRKVRDDGLIEIVLPWTDQKYGVVVKTTGRNIKETKRISEILSERYGNIG